VPRRNVPDSYVFAILFGFLQITQGITQDVEMYQTPTRGGSGGRTARSISQEITRRWQWPKRSSTSLPSNELVRQSLFVSILNPTKLSYFILLLQPPEETAYLASAIFLFFPRCFADSNSRIKLDSFNCLLQICTGGVAIYNT
jgi:hypothetical protein